MARLFRSVTLEATAHGTRCTVPIVLGTIVDLDQIVGDEPAHAAIDAKQKKCSATD